MRLLVIIIAVACALALAVNVYAVSTGAHKVKLPRDDVYYDIVNDADDQGNFILTIHVPVRDEHGNIQNGGKKVFCVVYKDHTADGPMGGMSCDWDGFHR